MVEKIIVNPTEVRGYGNIVNVKSDEDYEPVDCTITEDTDTVYGATVNVIVMEPDLGEATTLTVTSSSSTLVLDNTVNISATLKDSSNAAISGATITFKEGTTTLGNSTTNSSGVATYTYTGASVGDHTINAGFAGDSTYASSTGNVSVTVTDHVYSISFNQSSYVATGGSVEISCTLLRDSSPFSGATVSVTGSDSSVYTGITNNNGVASVTVSVSAETTFTATYSNVSDTCTVTVQSYLFRDGGVTGDYNSNYVDTGTGIVATVGSTGTNISCTANADRYRKANVLLSGDFKVTVTYTQTTNNGCSFALLNSSNTKQYSLEFGWNNMKDWDNNGSQLISDLKAVDDSPITYERVGSTLTVKCNGTQLLTRSITTIDVYFAWKTHKSGGRNFTFRDLTIEAL